MKVEVQEVREEVQDELPGMPTRRLRRYMR